MIEMEAAQVIAASAQGGLQSTDAGIGNGGTTKGASISSADARQGGIQNVSASELDF